MASLARRANPNTALCVLGNSIALYNPPTRVAEEMAMLDCISGGRLIAGFPVGSPMDTCYAYGQNPSQLRERYAEAHDFIKQAWTNPETFSFNGRFNQQRYVDIWPRPVQKPHPPLWVACSSRETIHLAAKLGIGALTFTFVDYDEAQHWVDDYYETFKNECVPIGHAVNPNIALLSGFSVHEDEQEALNRGIDGLRFFQFALGHFYRAGSHTPGRTDLWAEYMSKRDELVAGDMEGNISSSRGAIGTPQQVRDHLRHYADMGVDQTLFIQQGGNKSINGCLLYTSDAADE